MFSSPRKKKFTALSLLEAERFAIMERIAEVQRSIDALEVHADACIKAGLEEPLKEVRLTSSFFIFKSFPFINPILKKDLDSLSFDLQQSARLFEAAMENLCSASKGKLDIMPALTPLKGSIQALLKALSLRSS